MSTSKNTEPGYSEKSTLSTEDPNIATPPPPFVSKYELNFFMPCLLNPIKYI